MNKDVEPHYRFQNLQENNMTFEQVFAHIIKFMHRQPAGKYSLMVGTDSQVHHKQTLFITGIVIRNKGKGVWACMRKEIGRASCRERWEIKVVKGKAERRVSA